MENSPELSRIRIQKARKYWKRTMLVRASKKSLSSKKGRKQKLRLLAKKIIAPVWSFRLMNKYISLCREIGYGETHYYCNLAFMGYGEHEKHRCAVLEERMLVPFEDCHFYIMKGYDEALHEKYGDYMELPPVEKRRPKHRNNRFYWL